MNDVVIRVENLGKKYRIRHQEPERYTALRDVIAQKCTGLFRAFFGRNGSGSAPSPPFRSGKGLDEVFDSGSTTSDCTLHGPCSPSVEDFWALRDVSFEVKRGEVMGIIGRNGAGKSTLLKILSRITEPTEGRVRIRGRVASLLEVGTGFHPELTGRENIFLNGAILGMTKAEIKKKFDEIVAFAEIDKFLDTPVKRYSSGMYVRLAFAVAAHLEPEILIVDEVLAVGDAEFQEKCMGKMSAVAGRGRTVLFVSHNMGAVRHLCPRAILLQGGQICFDGKAPEVIRSYLLTTVEHPASTWVRPESPEELPPIFFKRIESRILGTQPRLNLVCNIELRCVDACPRTFLAVDVCDAIGSPIMQAVPLDRPFLLASEGEHHLKLEIDLPPLIPGRYTADFWIGTHYTATIDYVKNAISMDISDSPVPGRSFPHSSNHGFLVTTSRCDYEAPKKSNATALTTQ